MEKWLLLGATLLCAWILRDTIRLRRTVMKTPFEAIRHLWGSGTDHLTLNERESMRNRYASTLGIGSFVLIFLAATLGLATATVRAFLE